MSLVPGHWVTCLTSSELQLWSPEGWIIILDSSASVIVRDRRAGDLIFRNSAQLALMQRRWMALCDLQHTLQMGRLLRRVTMESWMTLIDIHDQEVTRLAERFRVLRICEVEGWSEEHVMVRGRLFFFLTSRRFLCEAAPRSCRPLVF